MAKTLDEMNRNERWQAKNTKRISFIINKNTDANLIDFLEKDNVVPKSEICRLGLQMVRLITDDLSVLTTYKADNGDEFYRVKNMLIPQHGVVKGEVKCKAIWKEKPVSHLSYYTEDGEFIATAGTHVHEKMGTMTEYLYTKRVSDQTQNDNTTKTLGYTV